MLFKVGDTIVNKNMLNRTVLSCDNKTKIYGLGFVNDPYQTEYKWTYNSAHETYKIYVPEHIPKSQRRKWLKENRKKNEKPHNRNFT